MIEILRKIWRFAGEEQKNIRTSVIGCFFFAVFHMFQMAAIYVIVLALVDGSTSSAPAWQALGLLLVSIIGRAVVNRFTQLQQTHAGYFMVANKRIAIGDKLKRVPMGYFNDKSLGELTGITTTVLDDVENTGPTRWIQYRHRGRWCYPLRRRKAADFHRPGHAEGRAHHYL